MENTGGCFLTDKLSWTLLTYHKMISGLQVCLWLQDSYFILCSWILHLVLFSCLLLSLSPRAVLASVVSLCAVHTWPGCSAVVWAINPGSKVGVFLVSLNWHFFSDSPLSVVSFSLLSVEVQRFWWDSDNEDLIDR